MTAVDLHNLPADVELLQELVRILAEALHLEDAEIAQLEHRLAVFCRHQFASRSERVDPAQLVLAFLGMQGESEAGPPEPPPAPPAAEPKKKGHGRRRLPPELPRERKWPELFLGALQADAYAGYDAMFAIDGIVEVACWADARRKFFEAQSTDAARASVALTFIKSLYNVEREAAARALDADARWSVRQEKARPVIDPFRAWLLTEVGVVLPKSPLGEAIGYTLDQWTALTRYLDDGRLDIDNNAAERALRRVAIGRKNWLFAGSDEGGRRAAIFYGLIETCRRHGVEPFAYLSDILERVSTHPARDIAALLTPNWKKAQEALQRQRAAAPPAPDPPFNTS